jgi:hypothetical protein
MKRGYIAPELKEKVELVMRVKDRYQRGQIRHRDLSREAARTQSSSTSLGVSMIRMKHTVSIFFLHISNA